MIYKAFTDTTATTIVIEIVYTTYMIYNVCEKENMQKCTVLITLMGKQFILEN